MDVISCELEVEAAPARAKANKWPRDQLGECARVRVAARPLPVGAPVAQEGAPGRRVDRQLADSDTDS